MLSNLARYQPPKLSQRFHVVQHSIFRNHAQPILDRRGQLHASQAVQMQILRQVQLIAHARMSLARDLPDQRQQPILRCAKRSIPAVLCRAVPR